MNNVIILAAGQGSRLRPLTEEVPKCMVKLNGRPLIHYQIESLCRAGIQKIVVVTGYCAERIYLPDTAADITTVHNEAYDETNMVWSLECACDHWQDGFILAYADIVYEPRLIKALLEPATAPVSMIVDTGWRKYWEARFENPLDDLETLRLNKAGRITEIGGKTDDISDIMGQFTGLVRFDKAGVESLRGALAATDMEVRRNMHTTSLLQTMIEANIHIQSILMERGWVEVDDKADLALAEDLCQIREETVSIPN